MFFFSNFFLTSRIFLFLKKILLLKSAKNLKLIFSEGEYKLIFYKHINIGTFGLCVLFGLLSTNNIRRIFKFSRCEI